MNLKLKINQFYPSASFSVILGCWSKTKSFPVVKKFHVYINLEISLVILNIGKKRNFREFSVKVSELIDKKKDWGSKWPIWDVLTVTGSARIALRKWTKFVFIHKGLSKNRPQNSLSRNDGVNIFNTPKYYDQNFDLSVRTCSCKLCVYQTEGRKKSCK